MRHLIPIYQVPLPARKKIPASPAKTSRKRGDFCSLFLHFYK